MFLIPKWNQEEKNQKTALWFLAANKGRERNNQLLCYFLINQAQHKVKKDFLIQLYITFNCLVGLDDSRGEE